MKFMDMIVGKVDCAKCKKAFKRSEAKDVTVGNRVYTLCNECSWDLEGWLHQPPIKKVTALPIEVVNVEEVKGEVEQKEGAE